MATELARKLIYISPKPKWPTFPLGAQKTKYWGKVLSIIVSQPARKVAALQQEGKGQFLLKISLDPFTEKDVKVAVDESAVRVTGSRGESTGMSNWSHHLDMVFPLPSNVKQGTVKTKFENSAVVIVTADTAK